MKKAVWMAILSITALFLLVGCQYTFVVEGRGAGKWSETTEKALPADPVKASDLAGITYVYEKEGAGGDFTISLVADGTFYYFEGPYSSHLGFGDWTLDGNVLHLSESRDVKSENYYFSVDGTDLVYIAKDSDRFMYVDLSDGERFACYYDIKAD